MPAIATSITEAEIDRILELAAMTHLPENEVFLIAQEYNEDRLWMLTPDIVAPIKVVRLVLLVKYITNLPSGPHLVRSVITAVAETHPHLIEQVLKYN